MEILIFSDSHGNADHMRRVILAHPEATHLLFCGDGLKDLIFLDREFPTIIHCEVAGNCDGFAILHNAEYEKVIDVGGVRILMMHGHTHFVKSSIGAAVSYAKKMGVNVLLFGHTHLPYDETFRFEDGSFLSVFNPGSIGYRENGVYSYGILTIKENGYLLSHGVIH